MTTETDAPEIEPRTEQVTVRVTASEKKAVQLLALLRNTTESDVLRAQTLDQIVAEAEEQRAKVAA